MRQLTQPGAIKRRILRVTGESGPRSMNILIVLACGNQAVLDEMVRDGELRKFSDRRHTKYGPPSAGKRGPRAGFARPFSLPPRRQGRAVSARLCAPKARGVDGKGKRRRG